MMVLTVPQPLATMAVHRFKRLDGRAWATNYRGPIALYAPKHLRRMTKKEFLRFCLDEPFRGPLYRELKIDTCHRLPRGHIVGVADLVGVDRLDMGEDLPSYPEIAMGGYGPLCCIWHLEDARPFDPPLRVPAHVARGGFWAPPQALREAIFCRAGMQLPARPQPATETDTMKAPTEKR